MARRHNADHLIVRHDFDVQLLGGNEALGQPQVETVGKDGRLNHGSVGNFEL